MMETRKQAAKTRIQELQNMTRRMLRMREIERSSHNNGLVGLGNLMKEAHQRQHDSEEGITEALKVDPYPIDKWD